MLSDSKYQSFSLHNFRQIPQLKKLPEKMLHEIEVVAHVLPFKVNNYIIDELIDWKNIPDDPIFRLTFPQRGMLSKEQFSEMEVILKQTTDKKKIIAKANKIRHSLNPNPGGQMDLNVPEVDGVKLRGLQHKYKETVLFFPSQGQTCHAYCTFCFRWPQFTGIDTLKFSSNEPALVVKYLRDHPSVTDIIFTGGDPMMMNAKVLATYINAILNAKLPGLNAIRIGTKAFAYWPYRFLTDPDTEELFELFHKIRKSKIHLALMAHFTHPNELKPLAARKAVNRVIKAGVQIRTQSPLIRGVNDDAEIWTELWKRELNLGCIPYYMFVARNTGSQPYFGVPLIRGWEIFRDALHGVSGICRTVRGPIMSCTPGKIEMAGVGEVNGKKVIVLRMIQGREPDWALKPFFAEYNEKALWIDELKPAFGLKKFFFENELRDRFHTFISDH